MNQWLNESFKNKYGALLHGTNLERRDKKWVLILVPASFFARRFSMCLTLVFWNKFIWGQVSASIMTSVLLIIMIGWYRPYESNFANNMELFNECVTLITLYIMFLFTDFVGESETRSYLGIAFMTNLSFYAGVHILFMIGNMCSKIRLAIRKKYYARRNRKLLEQMKKKREE